MSEDKTGKEDEFKAKSPFLSWLINVATGPLTEDKPVKKVAPISTEQTVETVAPQQATEINLSEETGVKPSVFKR